MRIALLVGTSVMLPVHRHPADRIALKRERPENRQHVFDRFKESQTAVRQGTVEAQRNAKSDRGVRYDSSGCQSRPLHEARQEDRERANVDSEQPEALNGTVDPIHAPHPFKRAAGYSAWPFHHSDKTRSALLKFMVTYGSLELLV
jgi:hypothetical protein